MSVVTRTVNYTTADGVTLQSYLCLPEQAPDELSGVLVAPEWWGLSEHVKRSAERLAEAVMRHWRWIYTAMRASPMMLNKPTNG